MPQLERPPVAAGERTQLAGWLDLQRATVRLKCEGLAEADEHRAVLPTSPLMTMAGVAFHLRWTEHSWFQGRMLGRARSDAPWNVSELPGATFRADGMSLTRLLDEYDAECAASREVFDAHSLDDLGFRPPGRDIEPYSLRWIVLHMIEETARHLGHLDAIRELLDGRTSYI